MRNWLAVILLITGVGLSAAIRIRIDRQELTQVAGEEEIYLRSGETLGRMSLGFNGLLADLYWIRTIRYFGREMEAQRASSDVIDLRHMPLLEPLLGITTGIDPHHIAAIRFGAFFLPYQDVEKAITFTRRGIEHNPDEWRLYQDLGMIFWRAGRFDEASGAYAAGAALEGAPDWMKGMAATMAAKGGDIETARELFTRLYQETSDGIIRQICIEQLANIDRADALRNR